MQWGPQIRPTRAIVDLDACVDNARILAKEAQCPIWAVVKADAYGHGACQVALALEAANAEHPGWLHGLAVSLVEEGVELREAGVESPILVMGPSLMEAHALVVEHALTPMVSDPRHLGPLSRAAERAGRELLVHLKVDTGMGRLGIAPQDLASTISEVASLPAVSLEGIASHLACADTDDVSDPESMSARQLGLFARLAASCAGQVSQSVKFHVANSAAILRFPESRYDLARPGLALYGNGADGALGLTQILRFVSQVSQVRRVPTGESVSYGARWTAQRDSTVAIVPLGYADGLPRNLNRAGRGTVLIGGMRCPILGTVSMDMIVVDITDHPKVGIGADVVVVGEQGGEQISVAEVAALSDISEYEVSCGISKRVPRSYVSKDGVSTDG